MTPSTVKFHRGAGSLELSYGDESSFTLSGEYLRVHSPSAEVRGHGPGEEVLQYGKKDVKISALEAAGHYALLIYFDDEHNTGIYSWAYLRELCDHQTEYWAAYLEKLNAAGQSRDPEEQALKFFNP
ncbi:1-(5-phosphoribosyl)-5-((5-phosphoribosylamino)methylideneamino)imidazole-4-carboxamide isomerase [Gammaproteobacteria bacterium 53_120_T64]|nr:1-(5-phosphoribosyl)-5-((5-phosphoribosylamino)methylideneamino)imidazole-4-carboxamide isomerase [Gammaproteobacteria bacterium 53_120_T64]